MDYAILNFIRAYLTCDFLDMVMPVFTRLCDKGIFPILVGLALLIFKKTRRAGMVVLGAIAVGGLLCNLCLKPLVARARPFAGMEDVFLLIAPPSDYSFPSGHTAAAFEFAFGLSRLGRRWAAVGYTFALLMGFSRLYLYVHFPTDVLAGAAVGTLAALIACGLLRLLAARWSALDRLAPPRKKNSSL